MLRYFTVPVAVALLVVGCTSVPVPGPTAVVRSTERPAPPTLVPTFTPTAPPPATATKPPTRVPTATATLSPTARPSATATARATATATASAVPTTAPSPTKAATRAATRAPTRQPAAATAAPPPAPAPGTAWKGEYFNNPDLSGEPVLVRYDPNIDFNWGLGSPDPSVPSDHFSVRWTRPVTIPAGQWRFHATSDDGVRVYVDGLPIIDQWHTTASVTYNTSMAVSGGNHDLRVDYYDNIEEANVRVWWEPDDGSATDPAHAGAWRGDYFDNRDLSGSPVFSRDDAAVYFHWDGAGPGGGISAQDFSVRWSRQMFIPGGDYLFEVRADDGVRLWIDWEAVIDEWHDSQAKTTYKQEKGIKNGVHAVVVEYYQGSGGAEIEVSWQPTIGDWLANLHTCLGADNSWVNVYRLAPNNQWEQLPTTDYGANTGGDLVMWGVPIDAAYGWDGQPYRVELWVNGKMTSSQGNIFAGEPAFRIMPGQDVHTSWPCGAQLPR
jgi:hypothetical protein